MSQRKTGTHYENQARRHLERAGLVFEAANVTYQSGEIDLIMRDGATWVFVEVRFRRNALFGGAAASVTYRKQQRLLRAAALWLAQRNACFATTLCRFDVFAITGSQLEWLPNAFNAD
ncbi:YraN family protein [Yersinia thracica]|nr:YraN family protein [Yersinia thracica]